MRLTVQKVLVFFKPNNHNKIPLTHKIKVLFRITYEHTQQPVNDLVPVFISVERPRRGRYRTRQDREVNN